MVAEQWLQRGRQSADPMEAFTSFWRAFNNLYGHSSNGPEVERLRAYVLNNQSESVAAELLSAMSSEVGYLLSRPVIDMRGNGKSTEAAISAHNSASTALERLGHVFTVIYQVRCNLEHGQKSPTIDRDLELCRCAAPIVASVVESSI